MYLFFFFSSRRRHTRSDRDWSSDVCSSDLAGLAAKMINQLVVGVGHVMLAEAVTLCEKAGVDAARIPECLGGGYADSNLMKAYWPRMVERDFAPRGYVRQLLKDLEMVSNWATGLEATIPMLTQALFLYRELAK